MAHMTWHGPSRQIRLPCVIRRVLEWLRSSRARPSPTSPPDPFAWKMAPVKPKPKGRSGAVAVAEPDER